MFYWSSHDTHVLLSDEEEVDLVRQLSKSSSERLGYFTNHTVRRMMEERISKHFEHLLREDPGRFIKNFAFRSYYDHQARNMFPALLRTYGRITRRATFGIHDELPSLEEFPDKLLYASTPEPFQVSLLGRGRWPWSPSQITGRLSFPAETLLRLAGTPDNFFAATTNLHMKFHRDFVRISVIDEVALRS